MALDPNINTLEKNKFVEIGTKTVVQVTNIGGVQVPSTAKYILADYPDSLTETYEFYTSNGGTLISTWTVTKLANGDFESLEIVDA